MTSRPSELPRSASESSAASSYAIVRADHADNAVISAGDAVNEAKKPSGACLACRRSKVKCEHDGTAPCKRCKNGSYECVFKPREGSSYVQDDWRIKTDETLEKLIAAMNTIVGRDQEHKTFRKRKHRDTTNVEESNARAYIAVAEKADNSGSSYRLRSTPPSKRPSMRFCTTEDWEVDLSASPTRDSHGHPASRPSIASSAASLSAIRSGTGLPETSTAAVQISAIHSRNAIPPCRPLNVFTSSQSLLADRTTDRTAVPSRSSQYKYPDRSLGSADPRLDAIRLGLITSIEARSLFSQYAKQVEPLGFGFPDFPASENLTPVLLSAIASTTVLHASDPGVRRKYLSLRNDVLERTVPFFPSSFTENFDPESGIGTEEVIGACIWSSYEGTLDAWRVARAARWWSEKCRYEQGSQGELTVGEIVAILPPVRHVNMLDRVRVWLSAYLTELHQCIIHERDSITALSDPERYSRILLKEADSDARQGFRVHNEEYESSQDVSLVFYAKVAYLTAKARTESSIAAIRPLVDRLSLTFYSSMLALGLSTDQSITETEVLHVHYVLARSYMFTRLLSVGLSASNSLETLHRDMELCKNSCLESIRLLASPNLRPKLALLPSIYHYWISSALSLLLELLLPGSYYFRLGLMAQAREDTFQVLDTFLSTYITELAVCDTPVLVEQNNEEEIWTTLRHCASDGANAMKESFGHVKATM